MIHFPQGASYFILLHIRRLAMENIKNSPRKPVLFVTLLCTLLGVPLVCAAAQGSFGYHGATLEVAWRGERAHKLEVTEIPHRR